MPTTEQKRTATPEVYALRYASMTGRRASELFVPHSGHDAKDRLIGMYCYFWLISSGSGVVLVDCGWSRDRGLGGASGRFSEIKIEQRDPIDLLAALDVSPSQVDHVIVSHMHFDHVGNLDLFPKATLSVARAELECWTGRYGDRLAVTHATAPEDVRVIADRERAGGVHLVDEAEEIVPGVVVSPVGGHTPGQMIVEVATPAGTVVLASDAAHYHEELDHDRPFYIYSDMLAMLGTYDLLRAKAAQPNTWIVTGHDPVEMDRFARVNADCIDLTRPIM